jgi:hypothetical protein
VSWMVGLTGYQPVGMVFGSNFRAQFVSFESELDLGSCVVLLEGAS